MAALMKPMVQMWFANQRRKLVDGQPAAQTEGEQGDLSPKQDLPNKLDDQQMHALMDVAETGRSAGFRERAHAAGSGHA